MKTKREGEKERERKVSFFFVFFRKSFTIYGNELIMGLEGRVVYRVRILSTLKLPYMVREM
jgi:hypothetical protein